MKLLAPFAKLAQAFHLLHCLVGTGWCLLSLQVTIFVGFLCLLEIQMVKHPVKKYNCSLQTTGQTFRLKRAVVVPLLSLLSFDMESSLLPVAPCLGLSNRSGQVCVEVKWVENLLTCLINGLKNLT